MSQNKTDRNDARSIAQLVRSGWFKSVHVKSLDNQELRTLLISREFLVNKVRDHENEIRGALRPFGLKVAQVGPRNFAHGVGELVSDRPRLVAFMEALLAARAIPATTAPATRARSSAFCTDSSRSRPPISLAHRLTISGGGHEQASWSGHVIRVSVLDRPTEPARV